ncbi:MAG: LacI family DNA-binding transcriptional regulator [Victivallaceae bacterium]
MGLVTLKHISEESGVSIRTVNRALKGEGGVGEEKRQRILRMAADMGYTPNIAARNLRLQKRNFVGIVTYTSPQTIFMRKNYDLQRRLEMKGFYPILGMLSADAQAAAEMLREWAGIVNTVVFFGGTGEWKQLDALHCLPQQCIFIDCNTVGASFHNLIIDRSSGIRDGILYLLENGRKKIARCGNIPNRDDGLSKAFNSFKGGKKPEYVYFQTDGSDFENGYEVGRRLVDSAADAVFFDTDRMAFGFLKYAWENKISIPKDIAVIGFDDDPWGMCSCPSLSTVAQPIVEMNEKIVELVENPVSPGQAYVFSTKFIKRESI